MNERAKSYIVAGLVVVLIALICLYVKQEKSVDVKESGKVAVTTDGTKSKIEKQTSTIAVATTEVEPVVESTTTTTYDNGVVEDDGTSIFSKSVEAAIKDMSGLDRETLIQMLTYISQSEKLSAIFSTRDVECAVSNGNRTFYLTGTKRAGIAEDSLLLFKTYTYQESETFDTVLSLESSLK